MGQGLQVSAKPGLYPFRLRLSSEAGKEAEAAKKSKIQNKIQKKQRLRTSPGAEFSLQPHPLGRGDSLKPE